MNKSLALLSLLLFTIGSYSQNFDWVTTVSGGGTLYAWDLAHDSDNNIIVCGRLKVDVTVGTGGSSQFSPGYGHTDIFLAKFDTASNLLWYKRMGGTEPDWGRSIAVDQYDNIYITGDFVNFCIFEGDTLWGYDNGETADNLQARTGFVAKYDTDGNFIWKNEFTGGDRCRGYGITADSLGNCYITGVIRDLTDFDGIVIGEANTREYGFVAKYNNNGICTWAYYIDSDYDAVGYDIQLIDNSTIMLAGSYEKGFNYDGQYITGISPTWGDYFLMQIDSSGSYIWSVTGTGIYINEGYNMVLDEDKNIYVTGHLSGTANFHDKSSNLDTTLISSGNGTTTLDIITNTDSFVAKYDVNGNRKWIDQLHCKFRAESTGITLLGDHSVVISGFTQDTMWFNNEQDTIFAENGFDTGFIIAYDTNGNYKWNKKAITTGSTYSMSYDAIIGNIIYTVSSDKHCNLYAGGTFGGTVHLDSNSIDIVSGHDIFIAKLFPPINASVSSAQTCLTDTILFLSENCGYPLSYSWTTENNPIIYNSLDSLLFSGTNAIDSITYIVSNGYETDTITLNIQLDSPYVNLGPDVTTCDSVYTINSGSVGIYYDWGAGFNIWDSLHVVNTSGIYTLTVQDANGCFASDDVAVYLDSCAFIHAYENGSISVYPNPTSDFIYFDDNFTGSDGLDIEILNLEGKYIAKLHRKNGERFDISQFHRGVYILRIYHNDELIKNQKVVIQ